MHSRSSHAQGYVDDDEHELISHLCLSFTFLIPVADLQHEPFADPQRRLEYSAWLDSLTVEEQDALRVNVIVDGQHRTVAATACQMLGVLPAGTLMSAVLVDPKTPRRALMLIATGEFFG